MTPVPKEQLESDRPNSKAIIIEESNREIISQPSSHLLATDIDGCDYYIFDSKKLFRPKFVCIEFNASIPNDVEFVQTKSSMVKHGASANALIKLGVEKGYSLVAVNSLQLY